MSTHTPIHFLQASLGEDPPGPASGRWFHRSLSLVALMAWLSLAVQVIPLIGWKGVDPAEDLLEKAQGRLGFLDLPTHLWWNSSDLSIQLGCWLGISLSSAALLGIYPRLLLPFSGLLYLSYIHAARVFLSFQWDFLLVELCVFSALVPRKDDGLVAFWLLRLVLFKVFFLSGIVKLQSPSGDWLNGSAMASYYWTAPLPTPFAPFFHALPGWFHTVESWATLGLELFLIWGVFCGRPGRRIALFALGVFLVLDGLTANYGFFLPLCMTMLWSLVGESQALRWESRSIPACISNIRLPTPRFPQWLSRSLASILVGTWLVSSLENIHAKYRSEALFSTHTARFARSWKLGNSFHLFGSITTSRREPEILTSDDGQTWVAQDLAFKPGPPDRAPPWVAPHQPRLDFRLWFQGIAWPAETPPYIAQLLARVCHQPEAIESLFAAKLPTDTRHVRIDYWEMRFRNPTEILSGGGWWSREFVGSSRELDCERLPR
jgi:hypothetical protein